MMHQEHNHRFANGEGESVQSNALRDLCHRVPLEIMPTVSRHGRFCCKTRRTTGSLCENLRTCDTRAKETTSLASRHAIAICIRC